MPAALVWNSALPTTLDSLHPRCGSFPWHTSALVEVCRQRLGRGVSDQILLVHCCAKLPRPLLGACALRQISSLSCQLPYKCAGCDDELKPAGATRALIESGPCSLSALPAGQSDRAAIATSGTNSTTGPDHRLNQPPAMVFVPEGSDDVRNGDDPRQHLAYRQIHAAPRSR